VFCCDPKRVPPALGVAEVELNSPPLGLGVLEGDPKRPPLGFGVSDLFPKSPPPVEPNFDGCPKVDVWGAGDVAKPNLDGAGVVVGVVDSGLCCAGNNESLDFAWGVSSVAPAVSISSSLGVGVVTSGLLVESVRADPKLLPNREPPGLAASSLADPSGLKELWSLKGVDPKGLPEDCSDLAGKAVSVFEVDPKGLAAG
jgi:hypothetical protein